MYRNALFSMVFLVASGVGNSYGQFALKKLKEKIKDKVEQRVDNKTDKAIDNTLDKAEGKGNKTGEQKSTTTTGKSSTASLDVKESEGIKSYSKYDFIPGDKIMYTDDFSQDAIGEFPLNWNTNGLGETVSVENLPGKWLKLNKSAKYVAGLKSKLPENATIEFDLLVQYAPEKGIPPYIDFYVFNHNGSAANGELADNPPGFDLSFRFNIGRGSESDDIVVRSRDAELHPFFIGQNVTHDMVSRVNGMNKPVHVSLWIQKQRVRIWLNQNKVFDAPKVIPENIVLDRVRLEIFGQTSIPGSEYYASNFKIAEGSPDMRSKLITEGKWSTNGILFDVNSDQIKPVSYAVLKEIAKTLTDNPTVNVKIVGHTDTDGDPAKNIELSKRRAAAVKSMLASEFGIESTRMETGGLGGTKPVADNKTPEGKAQNRRVEFVKI